MLTLVHGLGCSHRYFVPLWRLLPGAQCPELRGDSVAELADDLACVAPPRSLLVANSLGCEVAVELAVRAPERVEGLVLVGPTVDAGCRRLAPQTARLLADAFHEPPSLLPVIVADYARWGPRRLLRVARSMLADPIEDTLARVDAPVVVVRGEGDPICRAPWAARLASVAPRGRLVTIAGAGHAAHWSHPHAIVRLVEEVRDETREG